MTWNIVPECVSVVILCIIWIYSRSGRELPTLKNGMFRICITVTFCAMVSNILSTICIYNYRTVPLWLNWVVTTFYFLVTPLMGLSYYSYTVAVVYEGHPVVKDKIRQGLITSLGYVLLVLANPFTKYIFDINIKDGYVKGMFIVITYVVFYSYCLASVVLVICKRKNIDRQIFRILVSFPVFAAIVIIIQQFYPTVILSGSAATCALLIIYLHLQNKQITLDSLTGVTNRQGLFNMLAYMIKWSPDKPFTLIVVSLRGFRQINNSCGQQNGDILLKNICCYIDSVSPSGGTYRYGGDEFAVLFKRPGPDEAAAFVSLLKERMNSPWQAKEFQYLIKAAVGIVHYPEIADSQEGLIEAVEYAVSSAKKRENGFQVCSCGQDMLKEIRRNSYLLEILKHRLPAGEFEMYYQPIFSVDTGRYNYAESLMRLKDEELGFISPSEFIPIAEESGLIVEMTYQVLHKVCIFINKLMLDHVEIGKVHVNFSALQFEQPDLAEKVIEIISGHNTPFSTIKIEFTESIIAKNPEKVILFAERMRQIGIGLGLDDFGTGYSNIATMINIPFTTMKLDKSLVWSALKYHKSEISIRNLIRTFKELGMTVIAEGVETDEQKEFIIECGIDQIQGFYYARPMPGDDTIEFLKKQGGIA